MFLWNVETLDSAQAVLMDAGMNHPIVTAHVVHKHMALVRNLARRVRRATRSRVCVEELVSAGVVGLCEAIGRFDETRGTSLTTFAYPRIRGAMYDAVGRAGPVPRHCLQDVLVTSLGRPELLVDPETRDPQDTLARRSELRFLSRAVARLPRRHRQLLQRHYRDGVDLQQAGRELGISKSWASRLHQRALGELRTAVATCP